jgi:hypothetical protein
MKTTVETHVLESNKSNLIIELNEFSKKKYYVEFIQHIFEEEKQTILKINPLILPDLIRVLQIYYEQIFSESDEKRNFDIIRNQKIQDRYLKGVSIKDLALQFEISEEIIELILRNKGIEISSLNLPKNTHNKKKRK